MAYQTRGIETTFASKDGTLQEFKTRFGEWRWEKKQSRLGQRVGLAGPGEWLWHPLPKDTTKAQVKATITRLTTAEYVC